MQDLLRTIKSLEDSGILLDGITETVKKIVNKKIINKKIVRQRGY